MEKMVYTTLKRWESSLINFGKLDKWKIAEDYSILAEFIASKTSNKTRSAVQECRDYAIGGIVDTERLLSIVQNAIKKLNRRLTIMTNRDNEKFEIAGQAKRFKSTTRKLYNERLKRSEGKCLKDIDITMESGAMTRLVRRIVEKRMCQAYYRQNKKSDKSSGRGRHYMKRATSFQLHNLGQIEYEFGVFRSESTHWKRTYDPITGERVFKKKLGYSSYEEAARSAERLSRQWRDRRLVRPYQCAFCGKWHIGHYSSEIVETYPENVTLLGAAV